MVKCRLIMYSLSLGSQAFPCSLQNILSAQKDPCVLPRPFPEVQLHCQSSPKLNTSGLCVGSWDWMLALCRSQN